MMFNKEIVDRGKARFDDGMTAPLLIKFMEEIKPVIRSLCDKHIQKLVDSGIPKREADGAVMGNLIGLSLRHLMDAYPNVTKEIMMDMLGMIYDSIVFEVTDEEMFGGKKGS